MNIHRQRSKNRIKTNAEFFFPLFFHYYISPSCNCILVSYNALQKTSTLNCRSFFRAPKKTLVMNFDKQFFSLVNRDKKRENFHIPIALNFNVSVATLFDLDIINDKKRKENREKNWKFHFHRLRYQSERRERIRTIKLFRSRFKLTLVSYQHSTNTEYNIHAYEWNASSRDEARKNSALWNENSIHYLEIWSPIHFIVASYSHSNTSIKSRTNIRQQFERFVKYTEFTNYDFASQQPRWFTILINVASHVHATSTGEGCVVEYTRKHLAQYD